MPPSPKRHGLVVDVDESWPLSSNSPTPPPPSLTHSASSSTGSIDVLAPSTPTTDTAPSELLPGFHFSTTDENVDPAEFHRIAAQLLSGEPSRRDSAVAGSVVEHSQIRQLHCDLGRDPSGRYCCSCGKSYTTPVRLREHIATCAGTRQHPCATCDKVFDTRDRLDRHVATRHNNNLEACPECNQMFPASYLPKHLASGLGGCDGMIKTSFAPTPEIDRAYRYSSRVSPSQHFWIYNGDMSWQQLPSPTGTDPLEGERGDDIVEQTMDYVQRLLKRPALRPNMEACGLCGDLFSKEGDALARHIGGHSLDFAEKRHRCDECRIYFANEKDLDRHLQSAALNHHCGFTFRHESGTCMGHHPPTYYKSAISNDHDLMQRHLWAWELTQVRLHRVTVARLLAERLTSPRNSKCVSVQDCRRTYVSLLPHVTVAACTRDSMRPDSSDTARLDAHFHRLLLDAFPEHDDVVLTKIEEADSDLDLRPDSTIIPPRGTDSKKSHSSSLFSSSPSSKRRSFYDLTRRKPPSADPIKTVHKRSFSGSIGFLRQQALREYAARPNSLPVLPAIPAAPIVPSAA